MNILLLTQVLPYPPDSGPKVKTWNVLKYLAQQHSVTLVSFVRGDQTAHVQVLRRLCREVHVIPLARSPLHDGWALIRSWMTGKPWMLLRDDRMAMRRLVDRLSSKTSYDIVHVDQLNMAQYAARMRRACRVLDAHNALWVLYQRLWQTMAFGPQKWLLGRDWVLLKQHEGRICRDFDVVLAVSDEDRAALRDAMNDAQADIAVIPIAIDPEETVLVQRRPEADRALYVGTMYWPPNIDGVRWFVEHIWPRVRAQRPGIEFDVIGARPPKDLLRLNHSGSGINVIGYVSDPMPYLQRAGVFVVPLRAGGGMRVKILEALARGLPIVATSLGCEGIAVRDGYHLLIADTPDAFAEAIVRITSNPVLAQTLAQNGRHLIESTYDFRVACRPLESLYRPRGDK